MTPRLREELPVYLLYFVAMLVLLSGVGFGTGDDRWYAEYGARVPLFEFLARRYHEWSSRVLIEGALIVVLRSDPWVWRIITAALAAFVVLALTRVATAGGRRNAFLASLLALLLPLKVLHSAGWAATTLNYLWVAALGLVAFIPLAKVVRGESVGGAERAVCFLGAVYAANHEQMALILLGGYVAGGIYLIRVQRGDWSLLVPLGIAAAGIAFAVAAPGNHLRFTAETARLYPQFAEYSTGRKALLGYFSTASYYLAASNFNTVFLALSLAIFAGIVATRRRVSDRLLAGIPLGFVLIVGFLLRAATEGGKDTSFLRFLYNTRFVRMHGYGAPDFFAATILFTVILVCTVGALAQLWAGRGSLQAALVILGLGFLSRVVVGFSPTLYASGGRTTTFFSLAILTVTLMIVSDLFDKFSGRRSRGVGFALIGVLIALNGVVGAGWLG